MDLSSEFSRLFTSNHAPSEGEIKSIGQKISALEQKIDTINASNLELPRLKRERQAHQGLLSATRRIPVDVVGEILIFAIGGGALTGQDRKRVTDLCLVSRTWREAAMVTHCLWVSYELKMPCHPQDCEYAESWLKRSGCMAKTLSIDYPPDSSVFKYWALSTPNLIKFLKDGPTLQSIVISCDSPSPLRNLMQGLWTSTPGESLPWASVKFFRVDVRTDWEEHGQSGRTSTFLQYLPPIPILSF
ncbi:hypothetical protein FA13DRAFT_1230423 [Coprinellus micaceus]|uniref:F-box domain-containing protein n=1 Tax=Coprinellus micaceus TaxID=71717 RepID=A0A4Y7TQD2_COPMI|nr:hypothetical protein FA13DRAFT_1230423 [Coprinellus micaceus]